MAFFPSASHSVGKITKERVLSKRRKRQRGKGGENKATSFMGLNQGSAVTTHTHFILRIPQGFVVDQRTQYLISCLTEPFPLSLKIIWRCNILKINFWIQAEI